jgi:hypothetical protein
MLNGGWGSDHDRWRCGMAMMRGTSMRLVVALAALLLTELVRGENAAPPLPPTIGPYLQNPAPDAMTVCFLTQVPGEVRVLRGATVPESPCDVVASPIPGTPWTSWRSRITSLKPGETCAYRVVLQHAGKAVAEPPPATFTTPDPDAPATRLILFNDLHNQHATLAALMKRVKPEDYSLSVLLGDCWADPSPANGADLVFRTMDTYVRLLDAAHKPMLLVRGNHETRGGFSGRLALLFDISDLDPAQKPDDQMWPFALRAGPVFFVAMDTGEDDDFGTDEASYKRPKFWQEYRRRETPRLEKFMAGQRASSAPWKVFLSHIPLYNPSGWNSEPSRVCWEPILRDAGLDLMLAGHDHSWKLVPGGATFPRATKHQDGTTRTETLTSPCPVLIGGGPSLREGTVMLLDADKKKLHVRLLDTEGRLLTEVAVGANDVVERPPSNVVTALDLSPSYTKYIGVEGLPVLGSANVSDYGLLEAGYLIRRMIGHRTDVLNAMASNRVRVVVMAATEMTTDVPEHSDLKPKRYWDRRARGLGATQERPAVSCAEENLLCLRGDPYRQENILIHEFAHTIHEMGMSAVDPGFDRRLQASYDHARTSGLWTGTYAMQNRAEYWAEGSQSWFDTNRANDDDHGPVDTREEVKAYDPELAALLAEVYGDRAWRYVRPEERPSSERLHLAGFDPAKFPRFQWPAKAAEHPSADHDLPWLQPDSIPAASPRDEGRETTITFVNQRANDVEVKWIDADGRRQPYLVLRPGTSDVIGTFSGHVWVITENGADLGGAIAADGDGGVHIR